MGQNLSLMLDKNIALTSETTDLNSKSSWTPTEATQTEAGAKWGRNDGVAHSLSEGWNQYWAGGTTFNTTGSADKGGKVGYAQRGNYYNWFAATAGSGKPADISTTTDGNRIINGTVQDSICPKGWTLPVGGATDANSTNGFVKSFYNLAQLYIGKVGTGNYIPSVEVAMVYASPISFVPAGYYNLSSVLSDVGTRQFYWSGTTSSDAALALEMDYNSAMHVLYPGTGRSNNQGKGVGMSVRCVAR